MQDYVLLTRPFTQHNYGFNQLQYADDSLYDDCLIQETLSEFEGQNLLLSDESFSGKPIYFSYVNRSFIARRLSNLFPQACIIVFLRDQKDIIRSHYSSYVRMPFGTKKARDFFYKPAFDSTYSDYLREPRKYDERTLYYNTNDFYMHLDCFKFSSLVSTYKKYFEDCHFFLYEDLRHKPGEVISKLQSLLGVDLSGYNPSRANPALGAKALEKIRRANRWSYCFDSPIATKIARKIAMALPVYQSQNYAEGTKALVGDYFKKDNVLLKEMLPDLNWNEYPESYR